MKRIMISVIVLCLLLFTMGMTSVNGNKYVDVTITDYDVRVNDTLILNEESQYPVITYKNITYFPMTSDYMSGMGLELKFSNENGLKINVKDSVGEFDQSFLNASNKLGSTVRASLVPFPIEVNGKKIDNRQEAYPVLLYKNITYFPMTWRFVVDEFGWKTLWSNETGLGIIVENDAQKRIIEVEISDPVLEKEIREAIGIYSRPLTQGDLSEIEDLKLYNDNYGFTTGFKKIDVSDLKYFENLKSLYLRGYDCVNIETIAELELLESIRFENCAEVDLSLYEGHPNLNKIDLYSCDVVNP